MSEINESTFEAYSEGLSQLAEELIEKILRLQAEYARQVAKNPQVAQRLQRQIVQKYAELINTFEAQSVNMIRETLPKAYLRGIQQMNAEAKRLGKDITSDISIGQILAPGDISISPPHPPAIRLLEKYPQHLTLYQVFEAAAERDIKDMRLPIIRSASDPLRQIAIESGSVGYLEANELTRRQMSQDILNRFTDRGITGKITTGGRRFMVDSYAELVARTQTGNAARQAHINRQQQYGLDLVRISSHSPCSDLCRPWQGNVYSISGKSEKYPPFSDALSGGLYHPNCKHSQSAYVPGVSEQLENPGQFADQPKRDQKAYEIEQKQRYLERQVKYWKRREVTAVTEQAKKKASMKIGSYQSRLRDIVKEHGYLRRKYFREAI